MELVYTDNASPVFRPRRDIAKETFDLLLRRVPTELAWRILNFAGLYQSVSCRRIGTVQQPDMAIQVSVPSHQHHTARHRPQISTKHQQIRLPPTNYLATGPLGSRPLRRIMLEVKRIEESWHWPKEVPLLRVMLERRTARGSLKVVASQRVMAPSPVPTAGPSNRLFTSVWKNDGARTYDILDRAQLGDVLRVAILPGLPGPQRVVIKEVALHLFSEW